MNDYHVPSRLRAVLAALMLVALTPPAAQAQTGDDALRFGHRFPATGARMVGLGGAGFAGVADFYALYSNPAGLGYFERSAASGALASVAASDRGLYQSPGFTQNVENGVTTTGLDHLAYVAKAPTVRGSLVFGASYARVNTFDRELRFQGDNANNSITDYFMPLPGEFEIDVETEDGQQVYYPRFFRPLSLIAFETYAIDLDPDAVEAGAANPFYPAVTTGTVQQTGRVSEDGSVRELAFGGAFEAAPGVMVGLSGNVSVGGYHFLRTFGESDIDNANNGGGGTVDFASLEFVERLDADLVGVHLRGGFSAALVRDLTVGITIETPTFYSINESYGTRLTTDFDNGDRFTYGDDFSEDAGAGEFEYEFVTPWRLGTGVSFRHSGVLLLADAEVVDWSQLRFRANSDALYFDEQNQRIRDNFEAVVNLRAGIEYQLGDAFLRAGAALQPDPRAQDPLAATDVSYVDRSRTYLSAGAGYRFNEQFQVDLGWTQERFDDRYLPYSEVSGAPIVDEEVTRNRFALGVKVLF